MGRTKKSDTEDQDNRDIAARLVELREERGLSQTRVAEDLGISVPQLNALEAGRYSFSASFVIKLAQYFQVPFVRLLGMEPAADELSKLWRDLYDALPRRDRVLLHDLGSRLASWPRTTMQQMEHPPTPGHGFLISLEGIDGVLLHELGDQLAARMQGERGAVHCGYKEDSDLWKHLVRRSEEIGAVALDRRSVLERTLLYACDRIARQETLIRPHLHAGSIVLTPFFFLAAGVYQAMEGLQDNRVIDIVESLLVKPDLIVLLKSDPAIAARRATPGSPGPGQFYSPYNREQLARAQRLYEAAADQFEARGYRVGRLELEGEHITDDLVAELTSMVRRHGDDVRTCA